MSDIWMGWLKRESGRSGYSCMGDRGRAFGIYQFDYRYALVDFLNYCMAHSAVYNDFKPFAAMGKGNTELVGNEALRAIWTAHAASQDFCDLQDEFARAQYYEPAAKYLHNLYGIDAAEHSAALRGSLFSFAIRSGQLTGARKFSGGGNTEEELLVNAYAKYGQEDAGRWPEQLADALAALKEETKVALTQTTFLNGNIKTAEEAHAKGWVYGDSQSTPPCEDGRISCDRLVARTLAKYFGITNQKPGGWNSAELAAHLPNLGFTKTDSKSRITPGTVVMVAKGNDPTYHTFVVERYDPATDTCDKIDLGSTERIRAGGRFYGVPLCEWGDRRFSLAFIPPADAEPEPEPRRKYTATLALEQVKYGDKCSAVGFLQTVLKGLDYYTGRVDNDFGPKTDTAVREYQADKIVEGKQIGGNDGKPDGICGKGTWGALLGVTVKDA